MYWCSCRMLAQQKLHPPAIQARTRSGRCVATAKRAVLFPRCASGNGVSNSNSSNSPTSRTPEPNKQEQAEPSGVIPAYASVDVPSALDLVYESSAALRCSPVKTTGLRRAPLSGGVKTATQRFDLPSPSVAVRNLVEQAQFAHLCTVMSHMHHR
jgi:hypothetical protein